MREAIFLTVWLRRREEQVLTVRLLAQGLRSLVEINDGNGEPIQKVFELFLSAALPFMEKQKATSDEHLKEVMKKEVGRGMLTFSPLPDLLAKREKKLEIPENIREAARKVKARKGAQ